MKIKQIKIGFDNFCYVIYCQKNLKTVVVDPGNNPSNVIEFIKSNKLKLEYIINTHYHYDHSSGNQIIKNSIPSRIIASKLDGTKINGGVDIFVEDNDQLNVGEVSIKFLLTPGHTPGSICMIIDNEALLTGDTLFIGDCGRTDLPGGNLKEMFRTLQDKIKNLPDHLIVYPGHDYGDKPFDTIGNQKLTNKTLLAKNLRDFSKLT
ncbi:MAG: hydroxyacylglutathione hydrolase family protein [Candidatus Heimdallarchaeota archaeon]